MFIQPKFKYLFNFLIHNTWFNKGLPLDQDLEAQKFPRITHKDPLPGRNIQHFLH